ncbi:MAG: hypothetical protein GFH27_549301n239 [Chloroflexi bacterium AL-W]|nr:hypothetical protein [Chloroflexi bacterium AL-N1]NOK68433.1 hypothetical protein [Chloroflexi bacterium AL-N10]NOK74079.1 hypothetical protein [Chloroflexi bacterium AL-N5]NOK83046.1 hypothetical protein [Chloroflexi bacterium AL-W]NOK90569.1 hypothetical protein [Chloroflexi bacterium AL-N15]
MLCIDEGGISTAGEQQAVRDNLALHDEVTIPVMIS